MPTPEQTIDICIQMLSAIIDDGTIPRNIRRVADETRTILQNQDRQLGLRAAEAISKAKAQVPTSLSQVPAGSMAHHDENEAIRNMDMGRLSRTLEGKSPEEIMKLMSKVL